MGEARKRDDMGETWTESCFSAILPVGNGVMSHGASNRLFVLKPTSSFDFKGENFDGV
jgi:hypothetical protein